MDLMGHMDAVMLKSPFVHQVHLVHPITSEKLRTFSERGLEKSLFL